MTTMSSAPDDRALCAKFEGPYIANRGYDVMGAQTAACSVTVDLVPFGLPVLANPDPVRRYRENLPLHAADPSTLCGGGEAGYTGCPIYRGKETQAAKPSGRGWAER